MIVPFDALGVVYRLVHPPDVLIAEERYGDENVFAFDVRTSMVDAFLRQLTEKRLSQKL